MANCIKSLEWESSWRKDAVKHAVEHSQKLLYANWDEVFGVLRKKIWRVRVMRKIEDWVEVTADDSLQAEKNAAMVPHVIQVFGRSAIPAGKPVGQSVPIGVLEEEDE